MMILQGQLGQVNNFTKDYIMSKILTSHVGSLPRTQEVVDFIFARETGKPYDQAAFDAAMTAAVDETVGKQAKAGIDVKNLVCYICQRPLHWFFR
jgi:hypothetical protein